MLKSVRTRLAAVSDDVKAEQVASDACTRAGVFSLALALSLAGLSPMWDEERAEAAAGRYVVARWDLRTALEELDSNPAWQRRVNADPSLEKWTIANLEKLDIHEPESVPAASGIPTNVRIKLKIVDASKVAIALVPETASMPPPVAVASAPAIASASSSNPSTVPMPPVLAPIGLTITWEQNELPQVAGALRRLHDHDTLSLGRRASASSDVLIYRWQRKADLELKRDTSGSVHGLLGLSLSQVRELSEYAYPEFRPEIKPGRDKAVEVTVGALPRKLYAAALVLDGMLVFTLVYFCAFLLEAMRAPGFPSNGTLFAALRRSSLTLVGAAVAFVTPMAAALSVAVASRDPSLWAISAGVTVLTLWMLWRLRPHLRVSV